MNNIDKKNLDPEGFLIDLSLWNHDVARELAEYDAITLTEQHWFVIHFLRNYYTRFKHFPSMRILVKLLKDEQSEFEFNSHSLYHLFPDGVLKQGAKFAWLPKPPHCT